MAPPPSNYIVPLQKVVHEIPNVTSQTLVAPKRSVVQTTASILQFKPQVKKGNGMTPPPPNHRIPLQKVVRGIPNCFASFEKDVMKETVTSTKRCGTFTKYMQDSHGNDSNSPSLLAPIRSIIPSSFESFDTDVMKEAVTSTERNEVLMESEAILNGIVWNTQLLLPPERTDREGDEGDDIFSEQNAQSFLGASAATPTLGDERDASDDTLFEEHSESPVPLRRDDVQPVTTKTSLTGKSNLRLIYEDLDDSTLQYDNESPSSQSNHYQSTAETLTKEQVPEEAPGTEDSVHETHMRHGMGHSCSCYACRRENNAILKKLNYIIHMMDDKQGGIIPSQKEVRDTLLPAFPLTSVKDIQQFENDLNDSDVRRQFKHKIGRLGGKNGKLFLRNAFALVLTNEIAKLYSWTGRKRTLKMGGTNVANVIIETVFNIDKKTTMCDLEVAAREWLHHANDRWKYSMKKN